MYGSQFFIVMKNTGQNEIRRRSWRGAKDVLETWRHSLVTDEGNGSPVALRLGQEWCWMGRAWRTAGFITLLLDGDWVWVSIFLVYSVFLTTATYRRTQSRRQKQRHNKPGQKQNCLKHLGLCQSNTKTSNDCCGEFESCRRRCW